MIQIQSVDKEIMMNINSLLSLLSSMKTDNDVTSKSSDIDLYKHLILERMNFSSYSSILIPTLDKYRTNSIGNINEANILKKKLELIKNSIWSIIFKRSLVNVLRGVILILAIIIGFQYIQSNNKFIKSQKLDKIASHATQIITLKSIYDDNDKDQSAYLDEVFLASKWLMGKNSEIFETKDNPKGKEEDNKLRYSNYGYIKDRIQQLHNTSDIEDYEVALFTICHAFCENNKDVKKVSDLSEKDIKALKKIRSYAILRGKLIEKPSMSGLIAIFIGLLTALGLTVTTFLPTKQFS